MMIEDRPLPENREAERAVLGAILLRPDVFQVAEDVLDAGDFFSEPNRYIFFAMRRLHERKAAIDLVSLKTELEALGYLLQAGGPAYIAALVDGVPRSTSVEHYVRIIKKKATLRNLIITCQTAITTAYEHDALG